MKLRHYFLGFLQEAVAIFFPPENLQIPCHSDRKKRSDMFFSGGGCFFGFSLRRPKGRSLPQNVILSAAKNLFPPLKGGPKTAVGRDASCGPPRGRGFGPPAYRQNRFFVAYGSSE